MPLLPGLRNPITRRSAALYLHRKDAKVLLLAVAAVFALPLLIWLLAPLGGVIEIPSNTALLVSRVVVMALPCSLLLLIVFGLAFGVVRYMWGEWSQVRCAVVSMMLSLAIAAVFYASPTLNYAPDTAVAFATIVLPLVAVPLVIAVVYAARTQGITLTQLLAVEAAIAAGTLYVAAAGLVLIGAV